MHPDKGLETNERRSTTRVRWRQDPVVDQRPHSKRHKISRKIFIPTERAHGYYERLLTGHGGSKIKALEEEAGGRVSISVRDYIKDEQPHLLLEGDPSCVDNAESLINDLLQIPIISRKIMIPENRPGFNYVALLLGPGGSKVKSLETEAGGRVSILIRDGGRRGVSRKYDVKDEPPHVLLEGERICVDKAQWLINDLWKIVDRDDNKTCKIISRKIIIPVERYSECDHALLLIGPSGSTIKTLRHKAGQQVKILIRGRGTDNRNDKHLSDQPLHVLLEGELSHVDKAESLVNELLSQLMIRKIILPTRLGCNYIATLLGPGGSRVRALEVEAGGRASIQIRDETCTDEPPHVLLRGKFSCVYRAETLLCNLFQIHKMMIPVRSGCNYTALLLGPGGSKIRALEAEADGRVSIQIRDGKQRGFIRSYGIKDEPPHVLLCGERKYVDKIELLINDVWKIPDDNIRTFQHVEEPDIAKILKIIIPADRREYDVAASVIGSRGSRIKALVAEAGGRVKIELRGKGTVNHYSDEPLHVLLEGHAPCVDKAEFLIKDLLLIAEKKLKGAENANNMNQGNVCSTMQILEGVDAEKTEILTELKAVNANDDARPLSLVDRIHALENAIGIKFKSDEDMCNKIKTWEMKLLGEVKSGTIKERLSNLKGEIG